MPVSMDQPTKYLLDFTEAIFQAARKPHDIIPRVTKLSKPLPPPPLPPAKAIQKLPPPPELAPSPIIEPVTPARPSTLPPGPMRPMPPRTMPVKGQQVRPPFILPKLPAIPMTPMQPSSLPSEEELKEIQEEEKKKKEAEFKPISYPITKKDDKILSKVDILKENNKKIYKLTEPEVKTEVITYIKEKFGEKLAKNKAILNDDKTITKMLEKAAKVNKVSYSEDLKTAVMYYLKRDFLGLNKLDPLIKDGKVKKIICEGLNKPIKVVYKGEELTTNIVFTNNERLNNIVKNLAIKSNKTLSKEAPILDSTLENLKIHATLGTETEKGKFSLEPTVSSKIMIEKLS